MFTCGNICSSCRNTWRVLSHRSPPILSKRIKRPRARRLSFKECAIMPINQVLGGGLPQAFGGARPRGIGGGGGSQFDLNAVMEMLQKLLSGQGGGAAPAAGGASQAGPAGAGGPAAAGGCPSCKGKGCSRCQAGGSCPNCKGGCSCGGRGCSRCKRLGF